jgi:hypothetical protein
MINDVLLRPLYFALGFVLGAARRDPAAMADLENNR